MLIFDLLKLFMWSIVIWLTEFHLAIGYLSYPPNSATCRHSHELLDD